MVNVCFLTQTYHSTDRPVFGFYCNEIQTNDVIPVSCGHFTTSRAFRNSC
jgi:hypothetical protein